MFWSELTRHMFGKRCVGRSTRTPSLQAVNHYRHGTNSRGMYKYLYTTVGDGWVVEMEVHAARVHAGLAH